MKKVYLLLLAPGLLAGAGCGSATTETTTTTTAKEVATQAAIVVQPVPLPDPGIAGYRFPEDSATIEGWVQRHDSAAINRHGWGLWTALTSTIAPEKGDTMRVYQTWKTKQELAQDLATQPTPAQAKSLTTQKRALVRTLEPPRQFFHDPRQRQLMRHQARLGAGPGNIDTVNTVLDVVGYDPVAAQTILSRQLFSLDTLKSMLQHGKANIPRFPVRSVVVKPMYEVVPGPGRSQGPYQLKVWADIPRFRKPQGYGPDEWNSVVFVDINNQGRGAGQVTQRGQQATPATTYNVRDFVHYTLSKQEADQLDTLNAQNGNPPLGAKQGDIAILVGMHVTTSETTLWTWQTFWWAPNPAQTPLPATAGIMGARPPQLKGAPAHYAMSIGYQMIDPAQPLTGGNNIGRSVYAYNPYLEAGFSGFKEVAQVRTNGVLVTNNVGMRTNCMSCHAQANYSPTTGPGYLGNTYVDYKAPKFKGVLKTDFLWSIPDAAH